jgi:hypothetical protein
MRCAYCGYELEQAKRACPHCQKVNWICFYCGHSVKAVTYFCQTCGEIFWTSLLESTVAGIFAGNLLLVLLWPLSAKILPVILPRSLPWIARAGIFIGIWAAVGLVVVAWQALRACGIRRRFAECDAIPPRHDCPDWEYTPTGSCIQCGNCRTCVKQVQRILHRSWSAWDFSAEGKCMQVRTCLACGETEWRGPDHDWVSDGVTEHPHENYDYVEYTEKVESFHCRRCGEVTQVTL